MLTESGTSSLELRFTCFENIRIIFHNERRVFIDEFLQFIYRLVKSFVEFGLEFFQLFLELKMGFADLVEGVSGDGGDSFVFFGVLIVL